MAGVIFALEVLALEYSLSGFIPIILAAVSANAVSVAVFGNAPVFQLHPVFITTSLADFLPVLVVGVLAGAVSAAYIQSLQTIASLSRGLSFFWRVCLAGLAAGLCGALVPEVMGLGHDTQRSLLSEHLPLTFLLVFLFFELVATSNSVGLGIPGGTIGPALFMGAIVGNLTNAWTGHFIEIDSTHTSFHALLGMGAMMGASFQAPLAALTAVVELSHSPGVIMPGMLAIILASLTSRRVFGKDSLFLTMLRANGLDYRANPVVRDATPQRRWQCYEHEFRPSGGHPEPRGGRTDHEQGSRLDHRRSEWRAGLPHPGDRDRALPFAGEGCREVRPPGDAGGLVLARRSSIFRPRFKKHWTS